MAGQHRSSLIVLLLLVLIIGCGEDEGPAQDSGPYTFAAAEGERLKYACGARVEGDEFWESGRIEAARESHRRAYQYGREALAAQKGPAGRAEVLDFLTHLSLDIARYYQAHDYLGRAVEHANERLREDSRLFLPVKNKGLAYLIAGMVIPAQQILESVLAQNLDPVPAEMIKKNLTAVYYELAKRVLIEDTVGARAYARRALMRAMEIQPAEKEGFVDKLWAQLMQHYADEANAKKDDPLALARIHSRYGLADPLGAEFLEKAVKEHGRTLEVRWVEARYVEEMDGRPEALESAAEHYLQLMSRSDRGPFAAAGLGRVLLQLGRHEEALSKLEAVSDRTAELRRVLVLLRLVRIEALDPEERDGEKDEFEQIAALISSDMTAAVRARLLARIGLTALLRKNVGRLTWTIGELRRRFPEDPRIHVLDAELQELKFARGEE